MHHTSLSIKSVIQEALQISDVDGTEDTTTKPKNLVEQKVLTYVNSNDSPAVVSENTSTRSSN